MIATNQHSSSDLHSKPFVVGRTGKRISTASISSQNNIRVLAALVETRRPARTLEVGLALGCSALAMADGHRANVSSPAGHHVAIDPFQESVWDDCGVLALDAAGLSSFCTIMREHSWRALPRLTDAGEEFGILYIDGSHLFEDVFIDFFYCARLVGPGGIILFDDASDRHVAKVIRFVRRNMLHAFREIGLEGYRDMTTTADRLKYRAARALGRIQLVAFERIGDPVRTWDSPFTAF
ncbi:MAG TPA: class I SAM-dependent methyltransferase [Steroidobacter sp.]|nr:class I SAM-dependent methyltransferase [Steroidobacter sp.]